MTDIGNKKQHLGVGTASFNTENNTIMLYSSPSVAFVANVCPLYESRPPRAERVSGLKMLSRMPLAYCFSFFYQVVQ